MYPEAGILGDFGDLSANGGVEERDPTPDFAAEWVEKGVIAVTGCAPEGFVGALSGELESMPKT